MTMVFGRAAERTCRGCGCTDSHACAGGCSWVLFDIDEDTGVCSRCAERLHWHVGLLATVGVDPEGFAQVLDAIERSAA